MAKYLAQRIIEGAYTYSYVISIRLDLKEGIDQYLIEHDKQDLIEAK